VSGWGAGAPSIGKGSRWVEEAQTVKVYTEAGPSSTPLHQRNAIQFVCGQLDI